MVKKTKSSEKWGQLLASAIVTPNSFVVPNKILDEISVALSSILFKMGQDQPLAVLPNVVSSGKLSLILEAKQSPPVGSSVLKNWADQMETESSSSLVSGATFGSVWETITSHQRFAGWVASILVPSATFKIKLAHVKTIFQSVHGFLDAKSVSKNNVKLFCVEFASQILLNAAFLVELISSVHLATFKIAKSLVTALSVFGMITYVVLKSANIWQYVVVYFKKLNSVMFVLNYWLVLVGRDSVRILSLVNQNKTILSCDKFKAKLVNLPPGCTAFEISDMIFQVGGQSCFISRSPNSGYCLCFVLVTFGSQADLDLAVAKTGYLAVDCKVVSSPFPKASKVFKPYFVGFLSYAKAFAPPVMSEFPPLVASVSFVAVVDSAVGSRLDSLEKQISDLATLVKSIVEPVGSLVALVSHLLDDNAVKTIQLKKDLFSMKYASNNFANFLVGVSKDIACFRSEVDFNGMDYDDIQAAKPSLLSEDTVECYSVGGLVFILAKLETQLGVKTKHLKPAVANSIVEISAGSLVFTNMLTNGNKPVRLWDSKANSETSSISNISDLKNMKNMIVEETSYADLNASEVDNVIDDTTLKKICTRTYHLPAVESCVLNKCNFGPVKSFALNVELSAIPGKTNSDKLMAIKKIFYQIDNFGGERASTPSKFSEIIRASFTSEFSMNKAKKLAICKKIIVNDDLRKVNSHSNREVIVKKIPVDLPKSAVKSVFSKFGKIVLIKIQLIGLWQKALVKYKSSEIADLVVAKWSVFMRKDFVCVAKAVVKTMVHNLSGLMKSYGGKTCFIGYNPSSYVHDRCAVVCFVDKTSKLSAIGSTLVFKSVNLHWTGLSLVHCAQYKQFGHISAECSLDGNFGAYDKQVVPIICPVSFSGKTWAQIAGSSSFHVVLLDLFGTGSSSGAKTVSMVSNSLKCFLELLVDQISVIIKKLSFMELVLLTFVSYVSPLVVLASVTFNLDSDMALDNMMTSPSSPLSVVVNLVVDLSSSSSKVLTTKVGGLESKIVALEVLVGSVLKRLDCLCSGLNLLIFLTSQ
ncbi:hypothetical protein G9A89_011395 [Geosiphon pyriformis]|nr:hypothetical protein G9A89_011395 [Geosiphon pyriformis]